MTEQAPVTLERNGPIATLTLRRPETRNAINVPMAEAIESYVAETEADPAIRVAILAAEGPVFCAGADLAEVAAGRGMSLARPKTGFAGFVQSERTKPWVAAVQGPAHGGGTEIALACDMIVAGDTASFTLPEVRRGLIAGAGGAYRITRFLSRPLAIEMLLTGQSVSAQRAYDLGMVNRMVPAADVAATAHDLAETIAANSPLSIRETLKVVRAAADMGEADLLRIQKEAVETVLAGPDVREGATAFIEKRAPEWKT